MALIACPECKKRVSTHAKACPNCGYSVSKNHSSIGKHSKKEEDTFNFSSLMAVGILIVLLILVVTFFKSCSDKERQYRKDTYGVCDNCGRPSTEISGGLDLCDPCFKIFLNYKIKNSK